MYETVLNKIFIKYVWKHGKNNLKLQNCKKISKESKMWEILNISFKIECLVSISSVLQ